MKLSIELKEPGALAGKDLAGMWALYAPDHDVTREFFEDRLTGFSRIALFRERQSRRVIGFTGVRIREIDVGERRYGTLYFGQSYIDDAFRGRQLIQRTVTGLMIKLRARSPRTPWYLWSDALSYKPYLIMTRNLAVVYPHPSRSTPPDVKRLLDRLGEDYYGSRYQPGTGTVQKPERRLRDHVAPIGERELHDPMIRFYAQQNPGHLEGHGLLITCPLSLENLGSYVRRQVRRALRGGR